MPYIPLPAPPLDSLACTKFSPHDDSLIITTYDGSVLLYRCQTPERDIVPKLMSRFHSGCPVLSVAFTTSRGTFTGSSDGTVHQLDYENMKLSPQLYASQGDQTSDAIGNLCAVPGQENLLIASTFGGSLIYLDSRTQRAAHRVRTSSKIFAMDTTSSYLTVGQASRQVQIFDVRNWDAPCQTRTSGLKFQITALQNFPSEEGYALSSLDGRVSVEYYDESPQTQQKKFAFKCHRHKDKTTGTDSVYPVTALRFHHQTNTLITSGADGHVCLWDWERRKRTKQYAALDELRAISHMDINHDGSVLVVGANDDSHLRAKDYNSAVSTRGGKAYVRSLTESEH